MAFVERVLTVEISLGGGKSFAGVVPPSDTVTLSRLRCSVRITHAGGASYGEADIRLWGLTRSHLNQLSAFQQGVMLLRNNTVTVYAGDQDKQAVAFQGLITNAWADLTGSPDAALQINAIHAVTLAALSPTDPLTFPGATPVATIMEKIAGTMGLGFYNNEVTAVLAYPYLPGTPREQAQRVADAANCEWYILDGVLTIWPRSFGSGRAVDQVIATRTGMIGYPAYNGVGVVVNTLYNPTLQLGSEVQVESDLTAASGSYIIRNEIAHHLESKVPGGAWFSQFVGVPADAG